MTDEPKYEVHQMIDQVPLAARTGYVPATDLPWLEALRERHGQLAARLVEAVRGPDRERAHHAARAAAWRAQVRAAARDGGEPPPHDVRLTEAWLQGRVEAAEAVMASIVDRVFELLREADAECDAHGIDALVAPVDDGYGGALAAMERKLAGEAAVDGLPPWAAAVREWRAWRNQRATELQSFGRRDVGHCDPHPYGGAVRGTTLADHAAEERARVERARNAAAEQIAAANTTNDEQRRAA